MKRDRRRIKIQIGLLLVAAAGIAFAQLCASVDEHGALRSAKAVADIVRPARLAMLALCATIGGLMIPRIHPLNDNDYLKWLMTTPWHPRMPLPLGDPVPTLTDWIYIAVIEIGSMTLLRFPPGVMLTFFAAAFCVSAAPQLASTKQKWLAFGVFASAGLIPVVWPRVYIFAGIVLIDFALCVWGLKRSLRDYPWGRDQVKPANIELGWPIGRVGPVELPRPIPAPNAIAWSALIAWWLYIALRKNDAHSIMTTQAVVAVTGFFAALIRLAVYTGNRHAPLSLRGRLRTGHLFIPRYDIVYFGPIVTAAIAIGGPFALGALGLPRVQAIAVSAFLVMATLFVIGPTRRLFDLCGAHRMVGNRSGKTTEL